MMQTFRILTIFFVLAPAHSFAEWNGGFYRYTKQCRQSISRLRETAKIDLKDHLRNLDEDLGDFQAQTRIMNDPKEERSFREQVRRTAESTRQAILYGMKEIGSINSATAKVIVASCSIDSLRTVLDR